MKKVVGLLVMALAVAGVVALLNRRPMLFQNGESKYVIVLCDSASASESTAAHELQTYLEEISDALLPIINYCDLQEGQKHIFIGFNEEYASALGTERPDASDESFTYCTMRQNIWIYGGKDRGTMYGVYSFLENEFGVRWYTPDFTKIPKKEEWIVKKFCHSEQPFVKYRFDQYFNVEPHPEWNAHNKCNTKWGAEDNKYGGMSGYWNAHTFGQFIPADTYFAEHPEYFSLRDGKREPYAQLCLSNPEVLQICIEKMKEAIANNPLYWAYSMSQNDNQLPCQCPECVAIEEQYGSHSGLVLWFVNRVADAIKPLYPDKYIGTFAYQYTRKAPTGIAPRNNVVIRLCSIECCFAHPLEECEHNRPFIDDMEAWSEIAPNLYIWDYIVNYRQYLAPFPNFNVLAQNIKTFGENNAIGVQEEAQYQSIGGEFAEMKSWVVSKLLWNPNQDTQALVSQFINDYYEQAAPHIQQYFDLCHSQINAETVMGIYIDENNPLYTDTFISQASDILNEAQHAVASADDDVRYRVDLVKLQIDWLRMVRTPRETLADGTRDRVFAFVRKHNIRMNEFYDIEKTIQIYDEIYLKSS